MKKITVLIAALLVALPVAAQQPAKPEAPKEAAKPAPVQEAVKPAEAPAPMAKAAAPKKHTPSRRSEDARPCLERTSNTEIIKCAEEFL